MRHHPPTICCHSFLPACRGRRRPWLFPPPFTGEVLSAHLRAKRRGRMHMWPDFRHRPRPRRTSFILGRRSRTPKVGENRLIHMNKRYVLAGKEENNAIFSLAFRRIVRYMFVRGFFWRAGILR